MISGTINDVMSIRGRKVAYVIKREGPPNSMTLYVNEMAVATIGYIPEQYCYICDEQYFIDIRSAVKYALHIKHMG